MRERSDHTRFPRCASTTNRGASVPTEIPKRLRPTPTDRPLRSYGLGLLNTTSQPTLHTRCSTVPRGKRAAPAGGGGRAGLGGDDARRWPCVGGREGASA
eukprot:3396083-Rhodomonas_salina.2